MQLKSLKAKFIATVVLVYLVIGLGTLAAFWAGTRHIIDRMALSFAVKEALLQKNRVVSVIEREVVLARKMADDKSLKKWAYAEANPQVSREALEELESYRRFFRDKSFFIALAASRHYYVYDKKGSRVEMVTLNPAQPHDKWYFDGLNEITDCALNLDYSAALRETKVWFNALMKGDDGKKLGICGGGIDITDFLEEIVHSKEPGVATMLVDGAGVITAHQDRALVEKNAGIRDHALRTTVFTLMDVGSERLRLKEALVSLAAGKQEVVAFPASFGGRRYLVAASYMRGIDWFNVVLVDVPQVISTRAFSPIIAIMFVSLLLVIVTLTWLLNRMLLKPLKRLNDASREVAGGRYDLTLPLSGDDELGELTASFNTMTATILDHTKNLEAKVAARTEELSAAYLELAESQDRIMESIKYARIIQNSILPDLSSLTRCLGEHFVLYRPKQPVGGDFYYLREFGSRFLVAVIDCTGHGVPGAFVTMTVNSVLNHVVDVICRDDPARILAELNRALQNTLKFDEADAGLDIALCLVEREKGELTFAGAGLPLYLLEGGEIRELKGDAQRVGYKGSRLDYRYRNQPVALAGVAACYLVSDGLLDQPCGVKGYGLGGERLKALFRKNAHLPMARQLTVFEELLSGGAGPSRQRDDVTVLGWRTA